MADCSAPLQTLFPAIWVCSGRRVAGNLTNPWEILDRLLNRESGHRSLDIGRPDSSHCRHWLRCLQACSGPLEANGHRAQPVDDRPASGECLPDTALSARIPCPRLLSSMPTPILGEPADQKQHQGYCEQGPHNAAASFCWRIPQPCLDRTKPPPRALPELGPMHGEGDAVGQHHREPGLRGYAKAIRGDHQKANLARSPAIQIRSASGFAAGFLINWRSGVIASLSKSCTR